MQKKWSIAQKYGLPPPRKTVATALKYDASAGGAPRVVASGEGKTAERILALARENGIPICDDPVLAGMLAQVNVGDEIPEELYQVVAQVLAYIYRVSHPL